MKRGALVVVDVAALVRVASLVRGVVGKVADVSATPVARTSDAQGGGGCADDRTGAECACDDSSASAMCAVLPPDDGRSADGRTGACSACDDGGTSAECAVPARSTCRNSHAARCA